MEITLEQLKKYCAVKKSGAVNMSITKQVAKLAHLSPDVVRMIHSNFALLAERHKKDL